MSIEDQGVSIRRRVTVGALALLAAALVVYGIYRVSTSDAVVQKKVVSDVVQMRLVEPPPPPPPPPPRPKMIEQPKMRELEQRPTPVETPPQPKMNAAQPPGPLALDAQGQGAPDAFGLGGRPGGSDILGGGGGGGGAGSAYGWYATMVEARVHDALRQQRRLRGAHYDIGAKIYVGNDGSTQRIELLQSTGKAELDNVLVETLQRAVKLPPPPQGMPEPTVVHMSSS